MIGKKRRHKSPIQGMKKKTSIDSIDIKRVIWEITNFMSTFDNLDEMDKFLRHKLSELI